MKRFKSSFILLILLIYILPILSWFIYTYTLVPRPLSWSIILTGLTVLSLGSASLMTFYPQKEMVMGKAPANEEIANLLETINQHQTQLTLEKKEREKQLTELNQYQEQISNLEKEREELKKQLQQREDCFIKESANLQQIIHQLEMENRQKQQAYQQLENQIHDLRYELKTLLNLAETPPATKEIKDLPIQLEDFHPQAPITEQKEAEQLLKRCVKLTQEMMGSLSSRFLNVDPLILEKRRLGDLLNTEQGALILLYQPKQERVFLVNQELQNYLNWPEEEFCNRFHQLLDNDLTLWQQKVNEVTLTNQPLSFTIHLKDSSETFKLYHTLMTEIKTGIFRHFVIAIFY